MSLFLDNLSPQKSENMTAFALERGKFKSKKYIIILVPRVTPMKSEFHSFTLRGISSSLYNINVKEANITQENSIFQYKYIYSISLFGIRHITEI